MYLATALAGLEDALPVTTATREKERPVVEDLTGRFESGLAAHQWAVEKLLPRLHAKKVAILSATTMGCAPSWCREDPAGGLMPQADERRCAAGTLPPARRLLGHRRAHGGGTRALFAGDPATPCRRWPAARCTCAGRPSAICRFARAASALRQVKRRVLSPGRLPSSSPAAISSSRWGACVIVG